MHEPFVFYESGLAPLCSVVSIHGRTQHSRVARLACSKGLVRRCVSARWCDSAFLSLVVWLLPTG